MRNGSGVYVAPAGNPVITGTVIQTSWANSLVTDLGNELTNSLPRDGQAPMLAALKLIDGTAVAPGITFNSDTNTGLFRPGASSLALSVAGVEVIRLSSTSVLIGQTSSTGEKLQITGDAKLTGALAVSGAVAIGSATAANHASTKGYVDTLTASAVIVVSGTSQAATAGNHYILTNTGGVTTVTLPASPTAGDTVYVTNATTRTDALIARNGNLLFGLAEDFTFDKTDATVCLRFAGSSYGWRQA